MNNDALAVYERAARIHCQHSGIDPDTPVPVPHPLIQGATVDVPAWRLSAERLLDLSLLLSSLKQASREKPANEELH